MANMKKADHATELPPIGLVGRCFVIFAEHGEVNYQGIVRGDLGGGIYLIQYFEAFMGELSTLAVVPLQKMIGGRRGVGDWEFFENSEHLRDWIEHYRGGARSRVIA